MIQLLKFILDLAMASICAAGIGLLFAAPYSYAVACFFGGLIWWVLRRPWGPKMTDHHGPEYVRDQAKTAAVAPPNEAAAIVEAALHSPLFKKRLPHGKTKLNALFEHPGVLKIGRKVKHLLKYMLDLVTLSLAAAGLN